MTLRIMHDGVTPATVLAGAAAYAGYNDGKWPSFNALCDEYPSALHVSICVTATGAARVLDVEKGDATPEQAPGWVTAQRDAGEAYPVVYCNQRNTWPAVKAAFAAQHVDPPLYWVADYVNDPSQVPELPAGAIALQYYDYGGYDASVIADYWPGLDEPPAAHGAQTVPKETDVTTYYPIQVLPDPAGIPNACGVATWPQGGAHVVQLLADPGLWGAKTGQFRLAFNLATGPDVDTVATIAPGEKVAVELASVPGLNAAACSGVTITRPDGAKWPWGGGAA
jgi:hypothetical protein